MTYFPVSPTRNKLIAVGCDTFGVFFAFDSGGDRYITGCVALCYRRGEIEGVANESCSGIGCCEVSIPHGHVLTKAFYASQSASNSLVHNFNPCGYAFLVEDGMYRLAYKDLVKLEKKEFPVLLDWTIGNETCGQAKKDISSYACKAEKSSCHHHPGTKKSGYLCKCLDGYRGNPYLNHGCLGII